MNNQKELFTPIKRMRTFEEVSSKIKEQIFEGAIKPGDKLPSETQLAGQFKVGRQTIREALRLLERSGFITIQKGGGTYDTFLQALAMADTRYFTDAVHFAFPGGSAEHAQRKSLPH